MRAASILFTPQSGQAPSRSTSTVQTGQPPLPTPDFQGRPATRRPDRAGLDSGGQRTGVSAAVVQTTDEISLRFRCSSRLVAGIVTGLSVELRAVPRVAASAGVPWTIVMRVSADTAVLDGSVDRRLVRLPGLDEHRFRQVRHPKNDVAPVEPWSIVFTGLDTGGEPGHRGRSLRPSSTGLDPGQARWWRRQKPVGTVYRRADERSLNGPPVCGREGTGMRQVIHGESWSMRVRARSKPTTPAVSPSNRPR